LPALLEQLHTAGISPQPYCQVGGGTDTNRKVFFFKGINGKIPVIDTGKLTVRQTMNSIMLDAVSLMPKRSSSNTGANVHKSDTTVKGNLSRDTSQQLIPVSFKTCPLPLQTPNPCVMIPHHHVYSTQQQMTR
jgi:hypothetical protein